MKAHRGFALITVLWVVAGAASLTAMLALDARVSTEGARNRVLAESAAWQAFACAEEIRWSVDKALEHAAGEEGRRIAWLTLPVRMPDVRDDAISDCDVEFVASGSRVSINALDERRLRALFEGAALGRAVDPLVASFIDWTDGDATSRELGAERDWYQRADRMAPRDGPLTAPEELALIRGFEQVHTRLAPLITTDTARVALNAASRAVLLTVPGLGPETVDRLLARRRMGAFIDDPRDLLGGISEEAARALLSRYSDMVEATTVDPAAWTIRVRASVGSPAVESRVEVTLVRGTRRVVVTERRIW